MLVSQSILRQGDREFNGENGLNLSEAGVSCGEQKDMNFAQREKAGHYVTALLAVPGPHVSRESSAFWCTRESTVFPQQQLNKKPSFTNTHAESEGGRAKEVRGSVPPARRVFPKLLLLL